MNKYGTPLDAFAKVRGARIGLQHNLGLGGACVVTLYQSDHAQVVNDRLMLRNEVPRWRLDQALARKNSEVGETGFQLAPAGLQR